MPTSRIIRLRRPPTIVMQDAPYVPLPPKGTTGDVLDEVDRRWAALCAENPRHFDGRLCHVVGVHRNGHGGASVHVMDCAYRFYAVQDDAFDLGVRHLGVKGITRRGNSVLLGRRAGHVMAYSGMWEFAPGGVVEPGRDPQQVLHDELEEETGLRAARSHPVALVFDGVVCCWEIVYDMTVADTPAGPATDEYAARQWCEVGHWPTPLSPPSRSIAQLCSENAGM